MRNHLRPYIDSVASRSGCRHLRPPVLRQKCAGGLIFAWRSHALCAGKLTPMQEAMPAALLLPEFRMAQTIATTCGKSSFVCTSDSPQKKVIFSIATFSVHDAILDSSLQVNCIYGIQEFALISRGDRTRECPKEDYNVNLCKTQPRAFFGCSSNDPISGVFLGMACREAAL